MNEASRRRNIVRLAQMFAYLHGCATDDRPVGDCCLTRAEVTHDQLRARHNHPSQPVA